MASSALLVDTNVLLRLAAPRESLHGTALRAIESVGSRGSDLFAAGQNFIEFWNVATRPARANGFGQTPAAADQMLRRLEIAFPRLHETLDTYEYWRDLVLRFGVSGVQVHDARLVAVMLSNQVNTILTFNTSDFRRFADLGIKAIDPVDV